MANSQHLVLAGSRDSAPIDGRRFARPLGGLALAAGLLVAAGGCGGSGGSTPITGGNPGATQLVKMEFGRLVDVYGLARTPTGTTVRLHATDIVIGPDIQDERDTGSNKGDDEILYDFLSANPDNLQPRLLITRVIGTPEFDKAFAALGAKLRRIAPGVFGQNTSTQPHSVVPRNAAIKLTFSRNLGVDDDFFVKRDENGRIVGLKNSEAVQLLKIVGNPNDPNNSGDFEVIPSRLLPRDNVLVVDPVLLGTEGLQYNTRNNAAGLPEAPDQIGANIRIAIGLEGPLRIPGIGAQAGGSLVGFNNSGERAVIRDFRSGNRKDDSSDISQGFVRDPIPPRIVGELLMFLERVDERDEFSQVVTIYKHDKEHEIDRGDVLRLFTDNSGVPAAVTEVIEDPTDDEGDPSVKHVRVVVRRAEGLAAIDPSIKPGYPSAVGDREKWLLQNAPKAVLVAEYTAERRFGSKLYGDDPRNFVTFTPAPLALANGDPSPPNENVSPFAGAIIRFTKPVDLATVKALDSYFFGTRNLLDEGEVQDFIQSRRIDPNTFRHEKFITPHLVFAKVFDEDGSQTSLRLQPTLGFYLDETMRLSDQGKPFGQKKFRYFLHVKGGSGGVKDLSGNQVDFQSQISVRDQLVIPFSLDTRKNTTTNQPAFADNLSVTVARRFAGQDEDEQPSYYILDEVQQVNSDFNHRAFNLQDVFGGVIYLPNGQLSARPAGRIRRIADDLNQQPPPPQSTDQRFCPEQIGTEDQVVNGTAIRRFGQPIQNPLNPFGCRLQTVWREIDLNLSRTDPFDFNLDVEQMYWAPFVSNPITYDEFDRMSLFLGHSENRPEPCVGVFGALPTMTASGLVTTFDNNFVFNNDTSSNKEQGPQPFAAYVDKSLLVQTSLVTLEPNGTNRYLPLPEFTKKTGPGDPYFVWRDERVMEQGANSRRGFDTGITRNGNFKPFIISPFLTGRGRYVTAGPQFNIGAWDSRRNYRIVQTTQVDLQTGGAVGAIALPLLADFWVYPDSDDLPKDNPFRASGANGWQIAIPVGSAPTPNFRAYSGGGLVNNQPKTVSPGTRDWGIASGGYTPRGQRTRSADNSFYWIMADFNKRVSVATFGFVEILNPHRMPTPASDPRLGPYFAGGLPEGVLPSFNYVFEPSLESLPGGTRVVPEFRGAGIVDPAPWTSVINGYQPTPNPKNFPLDPLKAGDAHIRKYDDRAVNGKKRNHWTYYYNRNVTDYVEDPNTLMDSDFTNKFRAPTESFGPADVKYFNWRFSMFNNVQASPAITPTVESFAVTYRFEKK